MKKLSIIGLLICSVSIPAHGMMKYNKYNGKKAKIVEPSITVFKGYDPSRDYLDEYNYKKNLKKKLASSTYAMEMKYNTSNFVDEYYSNLSREKSRKLTKKNF